MFSTPSPASCGALGLLSTPSSVACGASDHRGVQSNAGGTSKNGTSKNGAGAAVKTKGAHVKAKSLVAAQVKSKSDSKSSVAAQVKSNADSKKRKATVMDVGGPVSLLIFEVCCCYGCLVNPEALASACSPTCKLPEAMGNTCVCWQTLSSMRGQQPDVESLKSNFFKHCDKYNNAMVEIEARVHQVDPRCMPRWIVPRPIEWLGPFAWGCAVCDSLFQSGSFSGKVHKDGVDEVLTLQPGKLTFCRLQVTSCFHKNSLKSNAKGAFHSHGMDFYLRGALDHASLNRVRFAPINDAKHGVPSAVVFAKAWEHITECSSLRMFCKLTCIQLMKLL